jgi:hypothetical protein
MFAWQSLSLTQVVNDVGGLPEVLDQLRQNERVTLW